MLDDFFTKQPFYRKSAEPLEFTYETRFSKRKTIGVYVYPDSRVEVRAPKRTAKRDIQYFVFEQREWIAKQLNRNKDLPPRLDLNYTDGELHYYLGKQFPLKIQLGIPRVIFDGDKINLFTKAPDNLDKNKNLLIEWYRQVAHIAYQSRLEACYSRFVQSGIDKPALRIRKMKTRWGSCSERGHINLSLELIKVPMEYIDYVIIHELCHLIEFNHSHRFYAVQSDMLPDWKQRKIGLNNFPMVCF